MTHSCSMPRPPPRGCVASSRQRTHPSLPQTASAGASFGVNPTTLTTATRFSVEGYAHRRPLHVSVAGGRRTGSISSSSAAAIHSTASHCSQLSSSTDCSRPSGIFSPPTTRVMATTTLHTPSSSRQWPTSSPRPLRLALYSSPVTLLSPVMMLTAF